MAVNLQGIRRNIKNVAHNYTDAQVKVREATSNDPWGPSSTLMSEIADLTYDGVAFSEIMPMIWKRLNDQGKNWRHVYKALVLLEYLMKTGSEHIKQNCKQNIHAIERLKEFQYLDDNKDHGINVRGKAKSLVSLLKDEERLKTERVRALRAKERFAQSTTGISKDSLRSFQDSSLGNVRGQPVQLLHVRREHSAPPSQVSQTEPSKTHTQVVRPQTADEDEIQIQLALAMSLEEAEQEERKAKSDNIRLQMAIQKSREDLTKEKPKPKPSDDLLDLDFGNPTAESEIQSVQHDLQQPPPPPPSRAIGASIDPWGSAPTSEPCANPWGAASATAFSTNPWGSASGKTSPAL